MSAWPLERTIRWGLAMATLTLLLLVGMTYFLLQETTHSALQSQAATNLHTDLRRIETFLLIAMIAIMGLCVALALLLRRVLLELKTHQADEAGLQAANQVLESLLENIPAMVFAKDAADLRFVRFNRAGERLLGYSRESLLGKSDRDFFPPEQASAFIAKDREVLAQAEVVDIPAEEIDTHDGRRILHTRKVPVRDPAGKAVFLLGISMDITEQKAAEARIIALNEEARRRAELLEASNRELESFCYSVSHDLRAPLRAINGFAHLLQQEFGAQLHGEGIRYLDTIAAASGRMARLIDDLLEFSRLGRQSLELDHLDMESIARDALADALLARSLPHPIVTIASLPRARGDRRLLHLVWLNLLDNAVKYSTGASEQRIEVWAESHDDEVIYNVRDRGIGFDMAYYAKLFGVFQRLHSNPAYPGTGVGLAIAHRVITRHGGRIWASSESGRGATFSFALPKTP